MVHADRSPAILCFIIDLQQWASFADPSQQAGMI